MTRHEVKYRALTLFLDPRASILHVGFAGKGLSAFLLNFISTCYKHFRTTSLKAQRLATLCALTNLKYNDLSMLSE